MSWYNWDTFVLYEKQLPWISEYLILFTVDVTRYLCLTRQNREIAEIEEQFMVV